MARLKRRSNGYYEKRFTYKGKRYSVYARKIADIDKMVQAKKEEIDREGEKKTAELTLDDYFEEFQEERIFNNSVKPSTVATHRRVYKKRIKDTFGNKLLIDIDKRSIKQFQRKLAETYKPGTVNQTLAVLSAVLSGAVNDDILTVNPCSGVRSLKDDTDILETTHRALSDNEVQNFFKYASISWYCDVFYFLLWTGCRVGEALALKWTDINFKKRRISINKTQTIDQDGKITTGDPKSKDGRRVLPMSDKLIDLLKKHRQDQLKIFGDTVESIDSLVFPDQNGNMARRSNVSQAINFTIKRAEKDGVEIKPFGCHAFRDSYATKCVDCGMRPETLQRLLGHSSITMTMDVYYHSCEEVREEEYNRVNFAV